MLFRIIANLFSYSFMISVVLALGLNCSVARAAVTDFTVDHSPILLGEIVTFTAVNDGMHNVTSWKWEYRATDSGCSGNWLTAASTSSSVTQECPFVGRREVRLTVTYSPFSGGGSNTITHYIDILPPNKCEPISGLNEFVHFSNPVVLRFRLMRGTSAIGTLPTGYIQEYIILKNGTHLDWFPEEEDLDNDGPLRRESNQIVDEQGFGNMTQQVLEYSPQRRNRSHKNPLSTRHDRRLHSNEILPLDHFRVDPYQERKQLQNRRSHTPSEPDPLVTTKETTDMALSRVGLATSALACCSLFNSHITSSADERSTARIELGKDSIIPIQSEQPDDQRSGPISIGVHPELPDDQVASHRWAAFELSTRSIDPEDRWIYFLEYLDNEDFSFLGWVGVVEEVDESVAGSRVVVRISPRLLTKDGAQAIPDDFVTETYDIRGGQVSFRSLSPHPEARPGIVSTY